MRRFARLALIGWSLAGPVAPGRAEAAPPALVCGDPPLEPAVQDGRSTPPWGKPDRPLPRLVPQPFKTFTEPSVLENPARAKVPAAFILTVDRGRRPEDDPFFPAAERAKARGWPVTVREGSHCVMQTRPEETATLIAGLR